MGMGYAAASVHVINAEGLKALAPNEYAAFLAGLEESNIDLDTYAQFYAMDIEVDDESFDEQVALKLQGLFEDLQQKFAEVTDTDGQGLGLGLSYHNSEDDGSRYDDVNGAFFYVNGVYQLTPAGRRFQDYISRANFVQFG